MEIIIMDQEELLTVYPSLCLFLKVVAALRPILICNISFYVLFRQCDSINEIDVQAIPFKNVSTEEFSFVRSGA